MYLKKVTKNITDRQNKAKAPDWSIKIRYKLKPKSFHKFNYFSFTYQLTPYF